LVFLVFHIGVREGQCNGTISSLPTLPLTSQLQCHDEGDAAMAASLGPFVDDDRLDLRETLFGADLLCMTIQRSSDPSVMLAHQGCDDSHGFAP
jgi:hypothetical protein